MKIVYILQDRNFFSRDHNVVGGHIAHINGVLKAFLQLNHELVIGAYEKIPYWEGSSKYILFPSCRFWVPIITGIWYHYSMTRTILRLIRTESPDLLYVRWSSNLFFSRIAKKHPDLPVVLECNSMLRMNRSYSIFRQWLARHEDRVMADTATVIGAVSNRLRDLLIENIPTATPEKILVNPNGVDSERFIFRETNLREQLGIPGDKTVIGFSGNFASWHRIDVLIRAVQQLERDVLLLIMGTGKKEILEELQEMASKENAHRVRFTGQVPFDSMPEYLSICDILAVPQDSVDNHRSPIKLFEYMSMGKAIVAADIGQISEVIQDRVNGLLFSPDDEASLRTALERLMEDSELRTRLGAKAREDAITLYTWEANVRRILSALNKE
jgi:glycosyltransferase involved in cell wall biosynthesis